MAQGTGGIVWRDLTVDNAEEVMAFYREVLGWVVTEVPMGDYVDYALSPGEGQDPVAGVCHRRGPNGDLPPQWLLYASVASVNEAVERAVAQGGRVVRPPMQMGSATMAVVADPAGAAMALWQSA